MIELKGLWKSFEDRDVLKDINATFENGKTNLIIGQSGSGKTVLMKCIVGLLTPERGELLYDNRNGEILSFPKLPCHGQEGKESIAPGNGNDFPECSIVRFHDCIG